MLEVKVMNKETGEYAAYFNGEMLPQIDKIKIESPANELTTVTLTFVVVPSKENVKIFGTHES